MVPKPTMIPPIFVIKHGLPIGSGQRYRAIEDALSRFKKIIIFTSPAITIHLEGQIQGMGISTFNLRHSGTRADVLNEFQLSDRGVIIASIHNASGWKVDGVDAVLFVDLHITAGGISRLFQGVARCEPKEVQFVGCNFVMTATTMRAWVFFLQWITSQPAIEFPLVIPSALSSDIFV